MNNTKISWIGKGVLLTYQNWFLAPDGEEYLRVWGTLKAVTSTSELYGFQTRGENANWVIEIGDMVIAGCQVKYAILCATCPVDRPVKGWSTHEGKLMEYVKPTISLYNANTIWF